MEQVKDKKMKGIISIVDENQHEKMEGVSIIDENEPQKIIGSSSQDEEELPDASSCSDDDDSDDDDDDSTDFDDDLSDMDELPSNQKSNYKVLSISEIVKCQDDDITNLSNVLSISRAEATILLLYCNWNIELVTDRWLSNAKEFREELGLPENLSTGLESLTTKAMNCGKCAAPAPEYLGSDAFCGHKFCKTCWQNYIGTSLKETHLILRCPDESCDAPVNQDIISMVALETDQKLYRGIFLRSYLADTSKGKWCPTPGCNHAVLVEPDSTISKFTCKCFISYCYKCLKEAHQPASCAIVESWRLESLNQSKNWQVACIRNCPKCHRSLEIKGWHKRMECSACSIHFCRLCLGSWLEYGHWEGDQYTHICSAEKLKEIAEDEKNRAKATNALAKYQEYFTQWRSLQMDQEQILLKLRTMQHEELKVLAEKQGIPLAEVSFVTDAWLQVAECKRVFKWACVYDYYFLVFHENRKPLFNILIRQGAFVMNQLCLCAAEVKMFIGTDAQTVQFEDFRERLCLKLSVARNYFANMEIAIQNDYQDMKALRWNICTRELIERKPATDVGTSSGLTESSGESTDSVCQHCNFPSDNTTAICVMCYH